MKIDGARIINDFIEPNKRQYTIPVYQRNYEWPREQCEKLFDDIVQAYKKDKQHFCGSIVYAPLKVERNIQYYVIVDGQQRLTTIYILLKALIDCAETERERELIEETVFNKDKYDTYDVDTYSKLKLKPITSDNNQLMLLMESRYDQIDKSSGIWINYDIFVELIKNLLEKDENMSVKNVFRGVENLICGNIRLEEQDNAQEIFERINSTGVPLSLADKIRNFVLMTDADQERLYVEYWREIERLVSKDQMSEFFLDYLNLKRDELAKEKTAYDDFKGYYLENKYTNESMLQELTHYAGFYSIFANGSDKLSPEINKYLLGLKQLKQTTLYLFLYRVFDDYYEEKLFDEKELAKVLKLLLGYSVRRITCEVASSSLRGLYKTLYNRVFARPENKKYYYDAIVSFLLQMTSRDVMPSETDFDFALRNNNLYDKKALCRYLLISIENQGKEQLETDNLSIEHIMPQNKNLSTVWQKMLGENWSEDRDRWLNTLGNLTLTGYNSELGDKPFKDKKRLIEEKKTKVVILYQDVQDKEYWNADTIQNRAKRLSGIVRSLFSYDEPTQKLSFIDTRYQEYTCADPSNATYKTVNYYELIGERVIVDNFADMRRSVVQKIYDLFPEVIERMAKNEEFFPGWQALTFSYDKTKVRNPMRIADSDIYMSSGYSAQGSIEFISALLRVCEMNIETDFIYSARSNKTEKEGEE